MVSRSEVLMGREVEFPLTDQYEQNLTHLLDCVNQLRTKYGKPMYVSSGYRPGAANRAAGGTQHSAHLSCEAVDFKDADGEIKKFCTVEVLEECGLYMEHPDSTPSWCHVQTRPTKNRVFKP